MRIGLLKWIVLLPALFMASLNLKAQCNFSIANTQVTPASCYGASDGSINFSVIATNTQISNIYWPTLATVYIDSSNVSGLGAGNYSVIITDTAGCSQSFQFTINQPDSLIALASNHTICPGETINLIDSVAGGTGPYHYSWTSTTGLSCLNCNTANVTLAHSQTFTVSVIDANGCVATNSVAVTVADSIKATFAIMPEKCGNDGRVIVNASGGIQTYRFSLNGGPRQSSSLFKGLNAGNYVIEVIDSIGCSRTKSFTIPSIQINMNASISSKQVDCPGDSNGKLTINTLPGTASWFSIDSVNLQTNPNFNNLPGGNYIVFIQDTNGCVRQKTAHIFEPVAPLISIQKSDLSCYNQMDGIVHVVNSGGSYPISSYYLNSATTQQSTGIFQNLAAGGYKVFLKDSNNCVYTDTVFLTQPPEIRIDSSAISSIICSGDTSGRIIVYASGGQSALQYSIDGVNYQYSDTFTNLGSGQYNLYVMDSSGCQTIETLTVTEPPAINIDAILIEPTCHGDADGAIIVITSGGTTVLVYSLDGEDYQFGNTFDSLKAGVYVVFVKDTNNCIYHGVFVLAEPDALSGGGTITIDSGKAGIDVYMTGGIMPYSYNWSHGDTTEDVSGLTDGVYTVVVTDSNGCTYTMQFDIIGTGLVFPGGDEYPIIIYPNPSSDMVNIRYGFDKGMMAEVIITDLLGRPAIQIPNVFVKQSIQRIPIRQLARGVYIVRIVFKNGIVTERIIKT